MSFIAVFAAEGGGGDAGVNGEIGAGGAIWLVGADVLLPFGSG